MCIRGLKFRTDFEDLKELNASGIECYKYEKFSIIWNVSPKYKSRFHENHKTDVRQSAYDFRGSL
jgi:hypothetical protein